MTIPVKADFHVTGQVGDRVPSPKIFLAGRPSESCSALFLFRLLACFWAGPLGGIAAASAAPAGVGSGTGTCTGTGTTASEHWHTALSSDRRSYTSRSQQECHQSATKRGCWQPMCAGALHTDIELRHQRADILLLSNSSYFFSKYHWHKRFRQSIKQTQGICTVEQGAVGYENYTTVKLSSPRWGVLIDHAIIYIKTTDPAMQPYSITPLGEANWSLTCFSVGWPQIHSCLSVEPSQRGLQRKSTGPRGWAGYWSDP